MKNVAQALIPLAILGLLVASDLLLCPIKLVLGFPCPGCGVTRATFALFHLDVAEALRLHPLVWLISPLVAWTLGRITLVSAGVISQGSFDPIDRLPKWFWWAAVVLLLGVWVIRLFGGLGGPSDPIDPANGLIGRALGALF
ncbi:MAG: DUF2752 domain-containing protein [Gammaproteobacteria bacterium]|nr:DUF2752 domain-containing protein [Gammaproteobacteria bacterium]